MDYSDLWDIMASFEGAPDGSTPPNLDLAQQIGDRGKRFVEERWRLEDLHSFSLLQILEVSHFSPFLCIDIGIEGAQSRFGPS